MDTARPENVGFSSSRLARVDQTMAKYVESGKLAGTLTLVARHGRSPTFSRLA